MRNPPVTASPCQPPLGKGAKGTGDADCHSQRARWSRNDTVNKRCGISPVRGVGDAAPYGWAQDVRWGGRPQGSPLRKFRNTCVGGDVSIAPP